MCRKHKTTVFYLMLLAGMPLLLAGCNDYDAYSVELTPRKRVIERDLTCWRIKGASENNEIIPFPKDELAAIAKLYEVPTPPDEAKKHHFVKQFTERMPDDIGGRGTYSYIATPMGGASVYVERFRGQDDIKLTMDEKDARLDELIDMLLGWFKQEMNDEAEFAKLKPFLDKQLRQDAKNLLRYLSMGHAAKYDEQGGKDAAVRVGQYLMERGYFSVAQLPTLYRAVHDSDSAAMLQLVRRFLATKMGTAADAPVPKSLDFLTDPDSAEKSWDAHVMKTPRYKKMLAEWEAADPRRGEKPASDDVTSRLTGLYFRDQPDKLELRLNCPGEPWETNGEWDAEKKQVAWSESIAADDELPTLCYAMWATPAVSYQKKHFGQIVLDGDDLQEFALWYKGLSKAEADQWNGFVTKLSPGESLVKRVQEFRFSGEPPEEEKAKLSGGPRGLILDKFPDEDDAAE